MQNMRRARWKSASPLWVRSSSKVIDPGPRGSRRLLRRLPVGLSAERSRSPAGASNASPGPVYCDVMRCLGAENLAEVVHGALHADRAHGTLVRDGIHCP